MGKDNGINEMSSNSSQGSLYFTLHQSPYKEHKSISSSPGK